MTNQTLPLAGYTVIELMGIGPAPYAGQLLASMGAHVTRFEKPGAIHLPVENKDKTCVPLDLQTQEGRSHVLEKLKTTDILIEGARPGVAEKLGLGPADCYKINEKLIYGRMTGWGQTGPWAHKAGHDINYIGLTGALYAMGPANRPPAPPLNLVGDYGGGSTFLVMGILAALLAAKKTGYGQVIDTAIIDGTASMMGIVFSLEKLGMWTPKRDSNLLDGSRPYYRCYQTGDGGYMAVGCLEPQFYAQMLEKLGLPLETFGGQHDARLFASQIETLTQIFGSQPRKYWEDMFEVSDACITPVLTYQETANHPQNIARQND